MEGKIESVAGPSSVKQPYEPPKATFVPLKLEERLLACSKVGICLPPLAAAPNLS